MATTPKMPVSTSHCFTEDAAIERFLSACWRVLEDHVLPEGFEADRSW
jgi:hypothetical protein